VPPDQQERQDHQRDRRYLCKRRIEHVGIAAEADPQVGGERHGGGQSEHGGSSKKARVCTEKLIRLTHG